MIACSTRHMDVPAAVGGELRVKTTLFARSLGASGRMPESPLNMERVMGIEPTLVAWEATVLPLNYTRFGWRFYSWHICTGNSAVCGTRT